MDHVEGKLPAVQRSRRVDAATSLLAEQPAAAGAVRQHHQAPTLAELDEAARLAAHVHRPGLEPIDQALCVEAAGHDQALEIAISDSDAQRAAALATARAAKIKRVCHPSTLN